VHPKNDWKKESELLDEIEEICTSQTFEG